MKKSIIPLLITAAALAFSCSGAKEITIAEQYGLAYAPLQIMKAKSYFEQLEPDADIEWVRLGNTAAIREAVLAGEVDAGFMGIPPFLIGADNGMKWHLVAGLSVCPLGLVAARGEDLSDIAPGTRIALPQPGSIQHILLSMAAEREFGDPGRFDGGLVTMKHPDGMAALFSGAVDAHFTSPPYLFMETEEGSGFSTVLDGFDAFGGEFSFIAAMAADEFASENPELLDSFLKALDMSVGYINENPADSAAILSEIYDIPEAELLEYITHPRMRYTTEILGLDEFRDFMKRAGYLKERG